MELQKHVFIILVLLILMTKNFVGTEPTLKDDTANHGSGFVYHDTRPSERGNIPQWDPNGYVFFCLCMGRIGNQIEHFLGGMAFAKSINRTLVLPPFRTYRNVRFTEWFKFEPLEEFHKVILAEDFIEYLAPKHWPKGQRLGFCYKIPQAEEKDMDCKMKEGNPFGPFWADLGIDFDGSVPYQLSYSMPDMSLWNKKFPPRDYPVLAMRGAPAPYPMVAEHRQLQQYLTFSDRLEDEANNYINNHFPDEDFVGIHLRNGIDWQNACKHAEGKARYMASPQCLDDPNKVVTSDMCLPSTTEILRLTKNVILKTNAKVVFVATDKMPMIEELSSHLQKQKVRVFHMDPYLPQVDQAILLKSSHFIGNCVSSFTSFVTRGRQLAKKPTSFWGLTH